MKKVAVPKNALRFLRWFCRKEFLDEIEGDLIEIFEKRFHQHPARARWRFAVGVIAHFRPMYIKSLRFSPVVNQNFMFRHNLLVAFRNFTRYKSSLLINLSGLSTGLAAVLLIYLWVNDERSVDKFHQNDDRLYVVKRNITSPSNTKETHESNSVLLPEALLAEIPEVEYAVPVRPTPPGVVVAGKEGIKATGWFVGKDFLRAFSYKIILGNEARLFDDKSSTVISEDLAFRLFGSSRNSLGKSFNWDMGPFGGTHTVTGVFQVEPHVSESFDFLVTHEAFMARSRMDVSWDSNPIMTCVVLREGTNEEELNSKLTAFYQAKRDSKNNEMFLQRYSDRYLYGRFENGKVAGGRIDYVVLFSIIAGFILTIACINFMNLSTARASRRLKEVGIKKAIGVRRRTLIAQHLTESLLITVFAFLVAGAIVFLFLPQFNLLTEKQLNITNDGNLLLGAMVIVLVTGIVSGSYPAFYLSRFKPVDILKGKLAAFSGDSLVRKGLVIFQFTISILLIVSVMIVYSQVDFVRSKSLGFQKENIILLDQQGELNRALAPFLSEVKSIPGVINASSARGTVSNFNSTSSGHRWEGQSPEIGEFEFGGAGVNFDFIETLGIEVKEGRGFSANFGTDEGSVILNETAVAAMGIDRPIGKWMELFGTRRVIVGVVRDFHFQSMHEKIKPFFMLCNPDFTNTIFIRIRPGTEQSTLASLEEIFHRQNPGLPFEFNFLDTQYDTLYASEMKVAGLSKYFAAIAIIISCLGLFGLASFMAERRSKEIGIRKILGCSELNIVRMLSADFTRMVFIAIVISLPLSFYLAQIWLQSFAYSIELKWWFFVCAGLAALFVAWITVGTQTWRAARVNPVETLRAE